MTWLFETPVYILCWGVLITACFLSGWIQTRRRPLAYLTACSLLITGSLVAVEHYVVTPLEEIELTLHQIAEDLESNHLANVLQHLHPRAREHVRYRAENEFPHYRFDRVAIKKNLEIELNTKAQPWEATARFNVLAIGNLAGRRGETIRVPREVEVTFWRDGDQWKVTDYKHQQPFGNRYRSTNR